jgi:hypothetical protein
VILRDRELLARVARVNTRLGEVVVELMAQQDDGQLPAHGVRKLGQQLTGLGADLLARAQELDRRTIDSVIDQDQLGRAP